MALSDTINLAEQRINDTVETSRTRLRAVVDTAEDRVEATIPRLREQAQVWRERRLEDTERLGGYVTDALTWVGDRLPEGSLPLADMTPSPEEMAGEWFEYAGRALEVQRTLTLEWIAALRRESAATAKGKATRAAKDAKDARESRKAA